jgi:hypothetical protein
MAALTPFLIHIPILITWVIYLKLRYQNEPLVPYFSYLFCYKILAGIAYGGVYIFYYGGVGDSFSYFYQGKVLADFAFQNLKAYLELVFYNKYFIINELSDLWLQPRAFAMVKIISVLNIICLNNYWVMGFYFSFFSFWGMWKLANQLVKLFPQTHFSALLAFLILPSIVFWSAGLNKESLALALIGFSVSRYLAYYTDNAFAGRSHLKSLGIWGLSFWLLWQIKFYYLAALLPSLLGFSITYWILKKIQSTKYQTFFKPLYRQVGLFFILSIGLGFLATNLHYSLDLNYFGFAIVYNHNSTYIFSHPEDLIHYSSYPVQGHITLDARWESLIYNAPWGFFASLFKPFIWEAGTNKLKLALAIENSLVLGLSLYAIGAFFRKKQTTKAYIQKENLLLIACLLYIVILQTLMAFTSPNMGSLARYRIASYMFYIYLIISQLEDSFLIKKLLAKISFARSSP